MTNTNAAALAAVNTDALIENNAAAMAAVTAEIQAQFPAALAALVARLQAAGDAWHAAHAPNVGPDVVEVDPTYRGRRFVRVVRRSPERASRSVVCFVELGTGLIYKAATFKAPTTNCTRGCVFNLGDMFRVAGTDRPAAVLPCF